MQHEQRRVPVTALAFWNRHVILAGEGGHLVAYSTDTKAAQAAVQIFDGHAIHGIIADRTGGNLFVWGGHLTCRVTLQTTDSGAVQFIKGETTRANDWILDAAFSESTHDRHQAVGLITAHNALVLAQLYITSGHHLQELIPGSNCILYCAHISWLSPSQCLIASGTAFGDIVVWSCEFNDIDGCISPTHQTHYTFSAHEGSVFGVQISSPSVAAALGNRKHVLASCSDDRTVRVWDISDLEMKSATLVEAQRDTGFGSKSKGGLNVPLCLAHTMGHISRIWYVRFAGFESQLVANNTAEALGAISLLSFGEDATCITWAVDEASDVRSGPPYSLRQLNTQKAHDGKNIWSLAMGPNQYLATGGADGSIALRPFSGDSARRQQQEGNSQDSIQNNKDSTFRSYGFLSSTEVLAITNQGKTVLVNLDHKEAISVQDLSPANPLLHGYSIMTSIPGTSFFAGAEGSIYAYDRGTGTTEVIMKTPLKVAGLFSQALNNSVTVSLLATNVGSTTSTWSSFRKIDADCGALVQLDIRSLLLPNGFIVTSFAHLSYLGQELVTIGSRNGAIAVYDLSRHMDNEKSISHHLLCANIHGNEAVSSLQSNGFNDTDTSCTIFSTGRDGTYAAHHIKIENSISFKTVHHLLLPFGPNIEGCGFSPQHHLWTWGFRGKQFVVYDITKQREIMNVECGGVHRTWVFHPDEFGGVFMWTKASKLYCHPQAQLPCELLNHGGHGREIKTVAISPGSLGLIATGAEDTNIKISLPQDGRSWRCLHTLQKHVTGVQHLQWSRDGRYLFSSGAFEEFFVWKINYDVPLLGIGVLCESTHPNSGQSDLRIMSFDVRQTTNQQDTDDDEAVVDFSITMVYSDSSIRLWRYQIRAWTLLASGDYLTSCLTQCLHLDHVRQETKILTASTDGHIASWEIDQTDNQKIQWVSRRKVHQNAILAVISHRMPDGSTILISGGDDNAIVISRCMETGIESLVVPRAHAAAVTALASVKTEGICSWLISASIDQRVKLWKLTFDAGHDGVDGIDLKLLKNVFTPVADVSSMDLVRLSGGDTGVLLCGVGLDLWRINQSSIGA